mmetsp:Transcript_35315/g.112369  ORF Transcript_35315/g.112369 Transcript_35315/m.112369 type:complete len:277 (-) Transcript_35315:587-1417(-)
MVSASNAFFAWRAMPASCVFSSSLRLRWISTCFLCSCASFRLASFFKSTSSCSCLSRTLHHSPKNLAVSTSSCFSRSRCARFLSSWAARLCMMSASQRRCNSCFSCRFFWSAASLACTWRSTRSPSLSCSWARRLDCASIMAFRACCFCWNTSSSFFFRSCSIRSLRAAYSWIFSSSRSCRSESAALICFKYSFACIVSCMAFTAWSRRARSASRSPCRSSSAFFRRSSPSSMPSSISRKRFSLNSESCSFWALAAIRESSSLVSFSFISRSSILR